MYGRLYGEEAKGGQSRKGYICVFKRGGGGKGEGGGKEKRNRVLGSLFWGVTLLMGSFVRKGEKGKFMNCRPQPSPFPREDDRGEGGAGQIDIGLFFQVQICRKSRTSVLS